MEMLAETETCFTITVSGVEMPSDTSGRRRLLWRIISMMISIVFEQAALLITWKILPPMHNNRCDICT